MVFKVYKGYRLLKDGYYESVFYVIDEKEELKEKIKKDADFIGKIKKGEKFI